MGFQEEFSIQKKRNVLFLEGWLKKPSDQTSTFVFSHFHADLIFIIKGVNLESVKPRQTQEFGAAQVPGWGGGGPLKKRWN